MAVALFCYGTRWVLFCYGTSQLPPHHAKIITIMHAQTSVTCCSYLPSFSFFVVPAGFFY
jgi:hypothetical protein